MDGRAVGPAPAPSGSPRGAASGSGAARVDAITRHRLGLLGLDAAALSALPPRLRADRVYQGFLDRVLVENLSDQRASREKPWRPEAWPRATDRFLRDNHTSGLGGRSFTLAYALADLFRGLSLVAHAVLGRNLVTEEVHAAVVVHPGTGVPLLYDPGLLASGPLPVVPDGVYEEPLGRLRLIPREGRSLTVFLRTPAVPRDRPLYALDPSPVPPNRFRQAWVASFCRGREGPLRFARRVGDEIRRWNQGLGRLEVLRPDGRERRELCASDTATLHAVFGIEEGCLRSFL